MNPDRIKEQIRETEAACDELYDQLRADLEATAVGITDFSVLVQQYACKLVELKVLRDKLATLSGKPAEGTLKKARTHRR